MIGIEKARKLDMVQTLTLQSGPRKSRKVDYADDSGETHVFSFDEELMCLQFALELVGEVVLVSRGMGMCAGEMMGTVQG